MTKPRYTFACLPSDRMVPFLTGEVGINGATIDMLLERSPPKLFRAMIRDAAFDIAEMSLGQCFEQAASGQSPFVALPIFPSRMFRHGYIFVNRRRGITEPRHLAGRRIGVQHHGMSAAVWIRHMLRSCHGVNLGGVTWVEGGVNSLDADVKVTGASAGTDLIIEQSADTCLSDLLARGDIDAMIGAWIPDCFGKHDDVARLFPDYRAQEQSYFSQTGIFPIMHALVIRADVHRADPTLARRIFDSCNLAKELMIRDHRSTGALSTMLPWLQSDIEEIDRVFGPDFWPYGLEKNRATLQAFADALQEEQAIARPIPLEDVFITLD